MESVFEKYLGSGQKYSTLKQDIACEVVVVGGGIAGLMTAYWLAKAGREVVLLEAETLLSGTTAKSTACITAMQGAIYSGLNKRSKEFAKQYFDAQIEGNQLFSELIKEHSIDCDYQNITSYVYADDDNTLLKKELDVLTSFGADVKYSLDIAPIGAAGAISLDNQGQLNITKFLNALPKHFDIYENTRVADFALKNKSVTTNLGYKVTADKIVLATRFVPAWQGLFFFKCHQTKSHVIAFDYPDLNANYCHTQNGLYFRTYNGMLLLGGFDKRTGRRLKENPYKKLRDKAKEYFGADIGIDNNQPANHNVDSMRACDHQNNDDDVQASDCQNHDDDVQASDCQNHDDDVQASECQNHDDDVQASDHQNADDDVQASDCQDVAVSHDLDTAAYSTQTKKTPERYYEWLAEDVMTFDKIPFAGYVNKKLTDVFVITGFNEWGLANAMTTSRLVSSLICGEQDKYKDLYDPSRPYFIKNMGAFLRHATVVAANLITGLFSGRRRRCPHMGCRLKHNKCDNTLECACHGSRFNHNGTAILDGPAVENVEQ